MPDDFLDPLDNPFVNPLEQHPEESATVQSSLDDVSTIVSDCAQIVASFQDTIEQDIASCLNICHGDIGLCQGCILGDIAAEINKAGATVQKCGYGIIDSVNAAMNSAWQSSLAVGIPPPTPEQIAAALARQPIPDVAPFAIPGGGGGDFVPPDPICATEDGVVVCPPSDPVKPPPPPEPPKPNPPPDCLPSNYTPADVMVWAILWYGPGTTVIRYPDATNLGYATNPNITVPGIIPALCGSVTSPPSVFPGPGEITLPGGGGTGTIINNPPPPSPPGGGQIIVINPPSGGGGGGGTIVNDPTGGGGGGTIINNPSNPGQPGGGGACTPPSQTIVNVPPCPTLPDQPPCTPCTDSSHITVDANSVSDPNQPSLWDDWLKNNQQGFKWRVYPSATLPGLALSSDGSACLAVSWAAVQPEQTPISKGPSVPPYGGNICDPSTISFTANSLDDLIVNANGKGDALLTPIAALASSLINQAILKLTGLSGIKGSQVISGLLGLASGSEIEPIVRSIITPKGDTGDCQSDGFIAATIWRAIGGVFSGWFGTVPPATVRQNEYMLNYLCPNILPSQAELNSLNIKGFITQGAWLNATKMIGSCPEWQRKSTEDARQRIGIQDAYRLWKLGQLSDDDFKEAWKRQRIDVDKDGDKWQKAIQQYPGMADLIRFMVKDVADPEAVKLLGLDGVGPSAFENKWTGDIQRWGNAQGISDDIARQFYRAHWNTPSPQTIYEWLHRLRDFDRSPDDTNAGVVFTETQARQLLEIADYTPAFIDYYIATAFKPLTRRDIGRLYRIGVLKDKDAVKRAFLDIGSTPQAAEQLAKGTVNTEAPAKAKLEGEIPAAEVLRLYRSNLATLVEATDLLRKSGLTEEQTQTSIDATDVRKSSDSRKVVIASLQKRYNRGEFTDAEATAKLNDAFMDLQDARDVVKQWSAQRQAKEKSPTIAMLCKWYGTGQISLADYMQRVNNLNYNAADALRIVQSCQQDVQAKRDKEIAAELDKLAKQQQAAARQQAAAIRAGKQQARALKLLHVTKNKVQVKNVNGKVTETVTTTVIDKPDDNVTNTNEHIDQDTLTGG